MWLFCAYSQRGLYGSSHSIRMFSPSCFIIRASQGCGLDLTWLLLWLHGFRTPVWLALQEAAFSGLARRLSCLRMSSSPFWDVIFDKGIRSSPVSLCGYFSIPSLWEFLRKQDRSRFFFLSCVTWLAILSPSSLTLSPGWWMALV